jgi:hypothetical protein
MKRARNPRTGLPLSRTQCNGRGCTATCAGRLWPADRHWFCPKCQAILDASESKAKFAPGRSGTRVPNLGTDVPEPEGGE